MDSTGPSQPSKDEAYTQSNNPISQTSSEKRDSSGYSDDSTVEARERGDIPLPSTHNADPTPSSLGYGARDASGDKPTGDVSSSGFSKTESDEQIAPYGEGEVAAAQRNKTGFGEQEDLASDIDRKKAEQAGLRAQIDSSTGSGGKVQEGQRGGIATD